MKTLTKQTLLIIALSAIFSAKAQDVIIKRTGDEIKAKITELGTETLKYKKWEKQDGADYVIKKSEVLMIRYEDGTKDIFPKESVKQTFNTFYGDPPGKQLIKFSRTYYVGTALVGVGTIVGVIALLSEYDLMGLYVGGSAMSLAGYVTMIVSFHHIGKAGKIMNNRQIGIALNSKGIGLNYRF